MEHPKGFPHSIVCSVEEHLRTLGIAPLARKMRSLPQEIGLLMCSRRVSLAWPGGVVSFTFDDFPKSALATGGAILERYGARGTFYASLKLAGAETILGPMFDEEDIRAAHHAGHEIACHTFTHLDCYRVPETL